MMNAKELELKLSDALQREDILKEKLAESQREFRAADATIENMQMQVEKLAAENAGLKNQLRELFNSCDTGERRGNGSLSGAAVPDWCVLEKTRQFLESAPATDAFLAEVRAQGVDVAIEHLIKKFEGTGRIGVPVMALEWLAKELRKGVQS